MSITLRDVRFDSQTGRLARNIAASERLAALLPQDEVTELLAAYDADRQQLAAERYLKRGQVRFLGHCTQTLSSQHFNSKRTLLVFTFPLHIFTMGFWGKSSILIVQENLILIFIVQTTTKTTTRRYTRTTTSRRTSLAWDMR